MCSRRNRNGSSEVRRNRTVVAGLRLRRERIEWAIADGPQQLEHGVEGRQIPFPRAGQEARRLEIAGEAGLFLETAKEREALPGEADADARFVVLAHQGAAVARRAAGDVAFLEQDDFEF